MLYKASLTKNVFDWRRNISNDCAVQNSFGKSFQIARAADLNARLPITILTRSVYWRWTSAEGRTRRGAQFVINDVGSEVVRILYVGTAILKSIRYIIGSQWSLFNIGRASTRSSASVSILAKQSCSRYSLVWWDVLENRVGTIKPGTNQWACNRLCSVIL